NKDIAAVPPNVVFPNSYPSNCTSLSSLFPSIFLRYLNRWEPQDDPTCDDVVAKNCASVGFTDATGKTVFYTVRQTSGDLLTNFSTWTFNGRTHKIPRAIRFLVKING